MTNIGYRILLTTVLFCMTFFSYSQTQKGLLIAIDDYAVPAGIKPSTYRLDWPSLDGCKNDALAVKAQITTHFGFKEKDIKELYNHEASRDAIIQSLNDLEQNSNRGDIVFIYYAGHGSQVKNSLSAEYDQKDETIVPADTWKEGVGDIRDKELARIWNRYIDKGIKLTLIFDCCHSGSVGRGLYQPKYRYIAESNLDVKDNSKTLAPEKRSHSAFLLFSASQDNEYAQEQKDENNIPHGAFTLSLIKALNQLSPRASAATIFNNVRAIIKGNGKSQEPVLTGDPERFNETLFGMAKSVLALNNMIPVIKVTGTTVLLQAGFASGIFPKNELISINGKDTTRIRIITVTGINQSEAEIVSAGVSKIYPGQLFEVDNRKKLASVPFLNIYIPTGYSYTQVSEISGALLKLKEHLQNKWVTDPEKERPDLLLNISQGKILLTDYSKGKQGVTEMSAIPRTLSAANKERKLFANIPVPDVLADTLKQILSQYPTVRICNDPMEAQYIVFGTIDLKGNPSYGLLRSDIGKNNFSTMPAFTGIKALPDSSLNACAAVSEHLLENVLKLARIKNWIDVVPPAGNDYFPFHLTMRNNKTKKDVSIPGVKPGDPLSLNIEADDNMQLKISKPQYIYAFVIDSKGEMQLLYPAAGEGSDENKFPFTLNGKIINKMVIRNDLEASEPLGTDSYILLVSSEPLVGYENLFTQTGVRGFQQTDDNSLFAMLTGKTNSRGIKGNIPVNWTLKKLFIVTRN